MVFEKKLCSLSQLGLVVTERVPIKAAQALPQIKVGFTLPFETT